MCLYLFTSTFRGILFEVWRAILLLDQSKLRSVSSQHSSFSLVNWYLVIYPLNCALSLTGTKLSEDSRKYGAENTCTCGSTLSQAALSYSRARALIEKEHGHLLKALGTQV